MEVLNEMNRLASKLRAIRGDARPGNLIIGDDTIQWSEETAITA